MKNITKVLSDEHQNILKVIESMLSTCEGLESGNQVDVIYFENAIAFIKIYADKYHHAKEEDILFKAMLENVNNIHCNPIHVMLYEHETGRNYVKGMEEGLTNNDKQQIIDNARGYCYLLKDHIYKEDNVLYPMAEEALSDNEKENVQRLYDEANAKNQHFTALLEYFGL